VFDAAVSSGNSFTNGSAGSAASLPDAVEFVYPTSSPTTVLAAPAPDLASNAPSATVANISGLAVGDFVLVSDNANGVVFKIATITPSGTSGGRLTMTTLASAVVAPPGLTLTTGASVFKVASAALYLSSTAPYVNMLMYDPDGILGVDHTDADPLIDGAVDLQLAVGIDGDGNGSFIENASAAGADEWSGNVAGELPLPATPWNGTGQPALRQVRTTLLVRTINTYALQPAALGPFEDRTTYPVTTVGSPRYRAERLIVAPRAWNLGN
jgi:hypothetical protein